MNITGLLNAIGDEKIQMQNLDQCAVSLDYSANKGTTITFGTQAAMSADDSHLTVKLGLILWLDRDDVAAALATEREKEGQP